jgi:hypothetical protein
MIHNDITPFIKAATADMKPISPTSGAFCALFADIYDAKSLSPIMRFDQIDHRIPYMTNTHIAKYSTHIGQRKLFLSELQFLTDNVPNAQDTLVVYAGAAPSNKTGLLTCLFPHLRFLLIDPNQFEIFTKPKFGQSAFKSPITDPVYLQREGDPPYTAGRAWSHMQVIKNKPNTRMFIINDFMTPLIAEALGNEFQNIYLISDIRTKSAKEDPDTTDIAWNNAQMFNWIRLMHPRMSALKFRHPFYVESPEILLRVGGNPLYKPDFDLARTTINGIAGIDFIANAIDHNMTFFDGTINLQVWSGDNSTEARLITDGLTMRNWGGPTDYENAFFYYNLIRRNYGFYENENADEGIGFDHCADCAMENVIWKNYLAKYAPVAQVLGFNTVRELVGLLADFTPQGSLLRTDHGRYFHQRALVNMTKMQVQHTAQEHTHPHEKRRYVPKGMNYADYNAFTS